MIPRTVQMAKEVAAQLTAPQLDDYGNVILNGYLEVVPNTINRKAWQYQETTAAPVNLPSLTEVRPALKGWTTNYQEYYTQLVNSYGVDPGDPTMFEYDVHSFTAASGTITSVGNLQGGSLYTVGTHLGVPAVGGSGTGATLDLTIGVGGVVLTAVIANPGSNYEVGDGLTVTSLGAGTGFAVFVTAITTVNPAGEPKWAQAPRRYNQQQVSSITPPQNINNPAVIQYSFMHPVADNPVAPPIDVL
jgi:hypothetical protein